MGLSYGFNKASLLTTVIIWSIVLYPLVSASPNDSVGLPVDLGTQNNLACRGIRKVPRDQQCAFAKRYCIDQDDGILSYVDFYYCRVSAAQPFGLLTLVLWMMFLFSSLGIVAGDFLAVNLNSIAQNLQMSDTLAGVTFLALGNGAPDIFSTIAAMGESSNNLALGELIGAAAFITSVVCGSMALIRSFDAVKIPLVRDSLFLLATIAFLLHILSDGHLRMWHCITLLSIYVVYIVIVVGWHWWKARRCESNAIDTTSIYDTEESERVPNENETLLSRDQVQYCGQEIPNYRQHQHQQTHRTHTALSPDCDILVVPISEVPGTGEEIRNFLSKVLHVLIPTYSKRGRFGLLHMMAYVAMLPMTIALRITTPRIEEEEMGISNDDRKSDERNDQENIHKLANAHWDRWLTIIHCFTAPQLIMWLIARQLSRSVSEMLWPCIICLGSSAVLAALSVLASSSDCRPRWWRLLSLPGFVVSIAWISALADEIVAVLKILGIICNIPDAIMGITAFAIGNSVDDWAANISVARRKRPVMALSACFGGPLLNILLGISISGFLAFARAATSEHKFSAIDLHPNRSLFLVSGSVILNIGLLLVMMLWTRWRMERVVGYVLSSLWIICTIVNVVWEVNR